MGWPRPHKWLEAKIGKKLDECGRNSSREYLRKMIQEQADSLPPAAMVLDAGAGNCMYSPQFEHVNYESADFCQVEKAYAKYGEITYVCDIAEIPVEDDRYDFVLLTQVLEHVNEPKAVLREMHRVLKPGGRMLVSAPLYYPEHETPYDFYRYTQYGLRHLLEGADFEVCSQDWMGGYYAMLAYQFGFAAWDLPARPRRYGGGVIGFLAAVMAFFLKRVLYILSHIFGRLDQRHKVTDTGHPADYVFLAEKPNRSDGGTPERGKAERKENT